MLEKLNPFTKLWGYIVEISGYLVEGSYWFCLVAGLIGLILYIMGLKKAKDSPMISLVVYIIIRMLSSVVFN